MRDSAPHDFHHEPAVAHARAIWRIALALAAVVVIAAGVAAGIAGFARRVPVTPQSVQRVPPPRLQTDPALDLAVYRAQQADELARYRWLDGTHQYAQIPIRRAMELLSQTGPARRQQDLVR